MSAMSGKWTAVTGTLALLAVCAVIGGCSGAGERLPECRGNAVPINSRVAVAPTSRVEVSGLRSDPGRASAGADDEP
jgi:hypothetical protein